MKNEKQPFPILVESMIHLFGVWDQRRDQQRLLDPEYRALRILEICLARSQNDESQTPQQRRSK